MNSIYTMNSKETWRSWLNGAAPPRVFPQAEVRNHARRHLQSPSILPMHQAISPII